MVGSEKREVPVGEISLEKRVVHPKRKDQRGEIREKK